MSVPAAYIGIIFIWSTTPLAVQWSNNSLSPIAAVAARMTLAAAVAITIMLLLKNQKLHVRQNWKLYAASSLGIFPNMPLVYWAAQYINSGLISVLFGLSPFFVGLLSSRILGDNTMNLRRYMALSVSMLGLVVIFMNQLALGPDAVLGILLMLLSVMIFSTSGVMVKGLTSNVPPMMQMTGSLIFSLPGLLVTWYCLDGLLPTSISMKSIYSVLYLALVGSVIGFMAYFYLLQKLSIATVSLISLITPAFALCLGAMINNEPLNVSIISGSSLIIFGLVLYNDAFSFNLVRKWLSS